MTAVASQPWIKVQVTDWGSFRFTNGHFERRILGPRCGLKSKITIENLPFSTSTMCCFILDQDGNMRLCWKTFQKVDRISTNRFGWISWKSETERPITQSLLGDSDGSFAERKGPYSAQKEEGTSARRRLLSILTKWQFQNVHGWGLWKEIGRVVWLLSERISENRQAHDKMDEHGHKCRNGVEWRGYGTRK